MDEKIKKIIEQLDARINLHNIIKEPISSDLDKAIKLSVAYEELLNENLKLQQELQQKEDIINKAKEYIKPKLNMKNKDGVSFLLFKRSHVEKILEILDNKGE